MTEIDGERRASPRLTELNQRLYWMQDVLRRYRHRSRIRNLLLAVLLSSIIGLVVVWFYSPESVRSTLISASVLLSILTAIGVLVVASRPVPTHSERAFLDLPSQASLTLPELELHYSRLREARRSHPGLGSVDHESQYEDDITYYVEELRARGVRSRRANNATQVVTIVGSLAATGIGGIALGVDALRWISPTLTFIVGTASGVAAIYKFKDRSFYAQQTANAIDQETSAYQLKIGRYRREANADDESADDARLRAVFLEEVHRLRTEQENREQNLDQPAQKSTDSE